MLFWTATIVGFSVFYPGAAYGHIMDALMMGSYSPGIQVHHFTVISVYL
ncbi:DUF6790 family protein [Methanothermobacter sp. K4]|nr:DUF6790 family protein [Methanothermobacter sp. K4]MCG2828916.1 hypothetical protein [Methanothermobacter sp. K4]